MYPLHRNLWADTLKYMIRSCSSFLFRVLSAKSRGCNWGWRCSSRFLDLGNLQSWIVGFLRGNFFRYHWRKNREGLEPVWTLPGIEQPVAVFYEDWGNPNLWSKYMNFAPKFFIQYRSHRTKLKLLWGKVSMKNSVFWDITPFGFCRNRRFGGT
jgi:hypothetical protein